MLAFPRWKAVLCWLVSLWALLATLPNVWSGMQEHGGGWLPSRTVNLGLDLQGGSYLLLAVDGDEFFQEQYQFLEEQVRIALRKENVSYRNLKVVGESVTFELPDPAQAELAQKTAGDVDARFSVSLEGSLVTLAMSDEAKNQAQIALIEQSIEIVRRRVDETGTREPIIQRQGKDRVLLQVPGLQDPEHLKRLLGQTAKLTFHLVDESVHPVSMMDKVPPTSRVLPDQDSQGKGPRYIAVERRPMLTGDMLVHASATLNEASPVVSFSFNSQGAKKFGEITRAHVNERFAIVLDNKVISAPVIREPILGGNGQISGSFSVETANDLALLLRAGALPAPLKVLEERTVGPSLGADSIESGKKASMIGLALVAFFMAVTYGLFGMFSVVALVVNMLMVLALLSVLQATLTLPGIAGIVLTMGMAVDANVLIFERIREEIKNGKSVMAAVDAGFDRAFTTIFDSNLTGLISAALLYYFGSGPVKGFAVTLTIGILTSMFSAVMLTRYMAVMYIRRRRPKLLSI